MQTQCAGVEQKAWARKCQERRAEKLRKKMKQAFNISQDGASVWQRGECHSLQSC